MAELSNADFYNILGAKITFIGYGILSLAAEKQAQSKGEKDTKIKEDLSTQATNLNNTGEWMTLAGDTISALAANLVAFDNKKTDNKLSDATKANLLGNWLTVLSDSVLIIASKLEAAESLSDITNNNKNNNTDNNADKNTNKNAN